MKHSNGHEAVVVAGSTKQTHLGGIAFTVRCCDQHEQTIHIQQPGKHSQSELLRIQNDHMVRIAEEHANHVAALEFLKGQEQDVTECEGCGAKA